MHQEGNSPKTRLRQISCPIARSNWKILLSNQKFKVLCPNGQLKSKQGTECELKFCHYFWHFNRSVYNISFQNRLKVTPLTSFVGSMSQRKGVIRFYMQFFTNINFWVQKSGMIGQLIYSVRLPHGATSCEKFVVACQKPFFLHNFSNFLVILLFLLIYKYLYLLLKIIHGFSWPDKNYG